MSNTSTPNVTQRDSGPPGSSSKGRENLSLRGTPSSLKGTGRGLSGRPPGLPTPSSTRKESDKEKKEKDDEPSLSTPSRKVLQEERIDYQFSQSGRRLDLGPLTRVGNILQSKSLDQDWKLDSDLEAPLSSEIKSKSSPALRVPPMSDRKGSGLRRPHTSTPHRDVLRREFEKTRGKTNLIPQLDKLSATAKPFDPRVKELSSESERRSVSFQEGGEGEAIQPPIVTRAEIHNQEQDDHEELGIDLGVNKPTLSIQLNPERDQLEDSEEEIATDSHWSQNLTQGGRYEGYSITIDEDQEDQPTEARVVASNVFEQFQALGIITSATELANQGLEEKVLYEIMVPKAIYFTGKYRDYPTDLAGRIQNVESAGLKRDHLSPSLIQAIDGAVKRSVRETFQDLTTMIQDQIAKLEKATEELKGVRDVKKGVLKLPKKESSLVAPSLITKEKDILPAPAIKDIPKSSRERFYEEEDQEDDGGIVLDTPSIRREQVETTMTKKILNPEHQQTGLVAKQREGLRDGFNEKYIEGFVAWLLEALDYDPSIEMTADLFYAILRASDGISEDDLSEEEVQTLISSYNFICYQQQENPKMSYKTPQDRMAGTINEPSRNPVELRSGYKSTLMERAQVDQLEKTWNKLQQFKMATSRGHVITLQNYPFDAEKMRKSLEEEDMLSVLDSKGLSRYQLLGLFMVYGASLGECKAFLTNINTDIKGKIIEGFTALTDHFKQARPARRD